MQKTNEIKELIDQGVYNDEFSNDEMIEIIKHIGSYMNLMNVRQYSDIHGISVQGVYSCRDVRELFGNKVVVDNS